MSRSHAGMSLVIVAVVGWILGAPLPAQVLQSGDLGIVGFQTNKFWVRKANGAVNAVTITNAPYFGSYSSATSQSILWDPSSPNSFIIGGFGFLGRATMVTATTATWTPFVPAFGMFPGEIAQMCWEGTGRIHMFDAASDAVQTVELASGVMAFATPAFAAWGYTLNAGTYDPHTRTWWIGNDAQVLKYTAAGGVVPVATFSWYTTSIIRDPRSTSLIAAIGPNNRLVRISPCGTIEDLTPAAAIPVPNSVIADLNGDFLVGDSPGGTYFRVWRVPNAGGVPALVATVSTNPSTGQSAAGLALVGQPLALSISTTLSGDREIRLSGIPAGTTEGWLLVSTTTTSCATYGPVFGILPDLVTWQILFGNPVASPGNPLHWVAGVSSPLFPAEPFVVPAAVAGAVAGQAWDFSAMTMGASGIPGAWNVQRYVW